MEIEALLNFFVEHKNETYTFNKIKKVFSNLHISDDELKRNLDALRINGSIFFDENTNNYSLCPPEYVVGTIVQSK